MNKIAEIFARITDVEHKAAVQEMKALSETGILNDGVVRNLAKRIANDVGIPSHDALRIAQNEVLRQAAYKWGGITSQSSQKDCLTYEGIASETTEDGRPIVAVWTDGVSLSSDNGNFPGLPGQSHCAMKLIPGSHYRVTVEKI